MRYSDEERQAALDCLAANEGNYAQTSKQTGISVKTLKRWAQQEATSGDELRQLRVQLAAFRSQESTTRHEDPRLQFAEKVLVILMDDAIRLADSIDEVIDDAPLNQRSAALNQLLGNIMKLMALLPPIEENVTRVEFIDCDDTAHETPYWSRNDPDE